MSKVAIVTDSNSGITQSEAKEYGVTVMPMPFFINDQTYYEDIDLTQEDFYQKLSEDANISTSMPLVGNVTDTWDALLQDYDEIVHIPMSSGLSGSCETAIMLSQDYDGRVQVVNNQRISVTQRQSVLDAKELAGKGYSAEAIKEILEREKMESSIYIMVDTLYYLKKGGRITPAAAALGTLLISLATGAAMYFNLSQQLSFWINGGFIGVNWEGVKLLFIVGIIGMGCAMLISKRITILSLGEDVAIGLGENTNRTRFIAIVIVILLTGASVSVAGNIIFVGLIIPQIVKKLVGVDFKYIIPCSFVLGSVLIVYSDVISRLINPPYETPIGSLTALLGVPVFIYLIRKEVK